MSIETKTVSTLDTAKMEITHEGLTLPVVWETTIGKAGKTGKRFATVDWEAVSVIVTDDKGNKTVDELATSGVLGKAFRGTKSLLSYVQADFDKAQVSLQVTTPANAKTPKTLTDDEKLAALLAYVSTIDEETKRRSGVTSELKRATKAMATFMQNPANFTLPDFADKLKALAMTIADLQAKADSASE